MSSRFDSASSHKKVSNADFDPKLQAFYMPAKNPQQILNYSFQTGEEFALEFIQERANTRPQFVAKNEIANKTQIPIMSPAGQKRLLSENILVKMRNESEMTEAKLSGLDEPEKNTSKSLKGSSRMSQPPINLYNFSKQNTIKFLCSFGGKFLPRPSDGAIRYVGGDTYILQLRKDISWKELIQKTTNLLNRAHTVKYHLPGEDLNILILVSCDEDVHHMMEECDVFKDSEEKPRLFLFSSLYDEEDSDIHSSDTDPEARFVAAVNAVTSTGFTDVDSSWSVFGNNEIDLGGPAGDSDQLIFYMDSDPSSYTGSCSSGGLAIPIKNPTDKKTYTGSITSQARKPFHKHFATNQETFVRYSGSSKIPMPSSLPSEFGFKTMSKLVYNQQELRPLDAGRIEFNSKINESSDNGSSLLNTGINATSSDENFRGSIGASSLGYSKSKDDLTSLSHLNSSRDSSFSALSRSGSPIESPKKAPDDANLIKDGHVEAKVLVTEAKIGSTKSFDRKQSRFGSHEKIKIDEIIGESNILRQHTIERSDPKNSIKSREQNTIKWHDDMAISNKELSKDGISVENFRISRPIKLEVSENKKENEVSVSSSNEERGKDIMESEQLGYHSQMVDYSNISWINEGSSRQIWHVSEEETSSFRLALSHNEELDLDHEPSQLTVDPLGSDLDLSNVQIIRNEDLEDLWVLGSGAFGTVYHGRWRGTDVAIKRIKNSYFTYQSSDKLLAEFWREAAILSKLHHPNVLAFYGVVKDGPGGSLATVTEFMVSGSLKRVLTRRDRYLDQRKRIMLAMDAAIGMEYLHGKNVVHFDLKCDNLLVNLKDLARPICKVADFGLSKMKETTMVSGGMRGTLPWMAPEQLDMRGNKVSEKIDVYSFGIVMWEILTGEEPYADMHYAQVIVGIMNNTLRPPIPSSCDPDWKRLMEQCWAADPEQRPSFTEIASRLRSILENCQAQPIV